MFQALAPRMPRGFSWVWLAIAALSLSTAVPPAVAQAPAAPKRPEVKPEPAQKPAEPPEDEAPRTEIFLDPNAKKALAKIDPLPFAGPPLRVGPGQPDAGTILNMTSGVVAIDATFLKRYIDFFAAELSKRDNINAVINPPANLAPNAARGMERAVESLIDPMLRARANNNASFQTAYSKALFESSLVRLLDNNLFARIDAMIVLGTAGGTSSSALDLYIAQLKKPDQVVWVKQWAARGLTNATRQGKDNLDASKTIQATEALIGLLESDPKLPYPVQMRALEALGSLRLAWSNVRGKVDAASTAMRFLADPEVKPEVRAWAAWALGMMKVPSQVSPYNFDLLGYQIGELAADLGRRIVEQYDANPENFDRGKDRASYLTSLLVFEVYPSLSGQEGVTESGLLRSTHPGLGASRPFLTKLDARVKDVSRESYEFLRAGGAAHKQKRDDLNARISDLRSFLAQAKPKDRHLVPGGPAFAPNPDQVAGAARP